LLELTRSFQWLDDFQAAEHAAREALSIYERRLPVTDPLRFSAMIRLSEVLRLQNRLDEAAQLLVEPIRQQERIFGKNDWHVADALDALADVRRAQGRIEEAVALKRQTVAIHSAAKGKEHAMTAYYRTSLGDLLCAASKYDEAEVELRQALDTLTRTLSADHQYIASAEYVLAIVMLKTKRPAEAELLLRASIQRLERADAPDWRVARSASALGEAMQMQGRTAEAKKYLVESYRVLNGNTAADVHTREAARMRLARFYPDLAVAVDIPERVEIAARKGARLPTRAHSPR
jgi:tetratricopeptide (TPR) repeat protein